MRLTTCAAAIFVLLALSVPGHASDWADCAGSDPDASIQGCSRIIKAGKEPRGNIAIAYNNRGNAYAAKGEKDRAMAEYDKAIKLSPNYPEAYNNRGITYFERGENDRAIADYDKAIKLNPDYSDAYNNRGNAYNAKGQNDSAIADYDKAIELNPNYAYAYNNRGIAYKEKGENDRAIADYNKAIETNPNYDYAYNNRGYVYATMGENDRAIADYDKAIKLNPGYAEAYNNRGNAYNAKGENDRAIADYNKTIELKPDYAYAYFGRGRSKKATGDLELALRDFRTAAQLIPQTDAWNAKAVEQVAAIEQKLKTAGATSASSDSSPSSPHASFGARVALVIGNTTYQAVSGLPNAVNDADLAGQALRTAGFGDVTVVKNLGRASLVEALRTFREKADKADWALVYYAGHGIEVGGRNFLIPIDARLKTDRDIDFEAIALDQVLGSVEGASKIRIVALDACRDNPFAAQLKVSGAKRSIGRGLARVEPDGSTLVLFAAREGTTASDGDGNNSPFATAFAKRVVEPGVELGKTLRLLSADVFEATGEQQEPVQYGRLPKDDFFFVPVK